MSSYRYRPERGAFDKRLVDLAERIEAAIEDDHNADLLKSIHRIAKLSSSYDTIYTDAVERVIDAERSTR